MKYEKMFVKIEISDELPNSVYFLGDFKMSTRFFFIFKVFFLPEMINEKPHEKK